MTGSDDVPPVFPTLAALLAEMTGSDDVPPGFPTLLFLAEMGGTSSVPPGFPTLAARLAEIFGADAVQSRFPDLVALLAEMSERAGVALDAGAIERHAASLHVAMLFAKRRASRFTRTLAGHDARRSAETGAEVFAASEPGLARGRTVQLERLLAAAQSGSIPRWIDAWSAASDTTRRKIVAALKLTDAIIAASRRDAPLPGVFRIDAPGRVMLSPYPNEAMPIIQALLATADRSRARIPDVDIGAAFTAAKAVFEAVTGHEAARSTNAERGALTGPFKRFTRELDDMYGVDLLRSDHRLRKKK